MNEIAEDHSGPLPEQGTFLAGIPRAGALRAGTLRAGALRAAVLLAAIVLAAFPAHSQAGDAPDGPAILLASTTSTENSGLFAHILPRFREDSGILVRVIALGTGQAIRLGMRGDADVLLVHHRPSEDRFMAEGHGAERRDVMYNDFVIAGPRHDPAGIRGMKDAAVALLKVARAGAEFVSRGDDSGTHKAELRLWEEGGLDPVKSSGKWYRETGSGMGATLNTAAAMGAYLLADRGTWLSFKNRKDLDLLVEGDPRMFNPYGVLVVNPARHPHVKSVEARVFMEWITGPRGREAISSFRLEGRQVFYPAAK